MAEPIEAARRDGPSRGLAASLAGLADGLGNLVAQHVQLARLEAEADARAVGGELARAAVFAALAVVGYALLCVAAAVALAQWLPLGAAFAAVGGVNLAGAAWGLMAAARRLKARKVLAGSLDEATRSAALFAREPSRG